MDNIILLFICLTTGVALRFSAKVPNNAHTAFNSFVIFVSLPALILDKIHQLRVEPALFYAVLMPWLLFAIGVVFFWVIGKAASLTPSTIGALTLCGGLANTSFVGFPMIQAFYGSDGLATGILLDQLGTWLVLSTIGVAIASFYSCGAASGRVVIKRVACFPPSIALLIAFVLMPVQYPDLVTSVLRRLGNLLTPLALISVGLQLHFAGLRDDRRVLALGLVFKLLLAPLVLAILYVVFLQASGDAIRVTLFEAAMGPMIGGAIIAIEHNLNPQLVTLMVGVGTILSFFTLPMWWYFLSLV
jgi:malate permease and related proteins